MLLIMSNMKRRSALPMAMELARSILPQPLTFIKSMAATLTATFRPGRFGALDIQKGQALSFKEKPEGDGAMINAGFFVLSPKVLKHVNSDQTVWDQEPLINLAAEGELMADEHHCFWSSMDTLRNKDLLEELWVSGKAS